MFLYVTFGHVRDSSIRIVVQLDAVLAVNFLGIPNPNTLQSVTIMSIFSKADVPLLNE